MVVEINFTQFIKLKTIFGFSDFCQNQHVMYEYLCERKEMKNSFTDASLEMFRDLANLYSLFLLYADF